MRHVRYIHFTLAESSYDMLGIGYTPKTDRGGGDEYLIT